jgi:hypothetical protein
MKWSIGWHLQEDIWTAVHECVMEGSLNNYNSSDKTPNQEQINYVTRPKCKYLVNNITVFRNVCILEHYQ